MKRTTHILVLVFLALSSSGCLVSNLMSQLRPDTSNSDQLPSDFEIWSRGIATGIKIGSGQENLSNFREYIEIDLTGMDENGVPAHGFQESLREIDRNTDNIREIQTLETPGHFLNGTMEWVEMDGFTYLVRELSQRGRVCEKEEIPEDTSHYSEEYVTRILNTITPGDLLESNVLLNGVLADVYEIENIVMLFVREMNTVNGKVWIAQQPNYFLKAEGSIEGVLEFENRYYTGQAAFHFEVYDFDQVQIKLPVLCAYPPEDMLPIPDNAKDMTDFGGLIAFSSPDPEDQVLNYYLAELESGGWLVEDLSKTHFEQIILAKITTPQDIQISIEVKIISMGDGSTRVQMKWVASEL